MRTHCLKRLTATLVLLLTPALALAEVSVQLNRDGSVRKVLYLTRGSGPHAIVWRQVRAFIAPQFILNPLGDNLGDLPPFIVSHPVTRQPWVIWSMNLANQKRIGFSRWTGSNWTDPRPVVPVPGSMYYDQLDPVLTFDAAGTPYLVWWQAEPVAKVYFSTLVRNAWTPPLAISDPSTDSRRPSVALDGSKLLVTVTTPTGKAAIRRSASVLVESAASLMDSPIPPGSTQAPGTTGGSNSSDGEDPPLIKR